MGSVKKKLTKTLRKITPKEIAPILPFVAMAVPGMLPAAGIFGSTAMRYALPQLLTAAGSARQTGDINLLNQAMALAGSYAAGPGGAGSSTGQKAFMDDTLMGGVNPGAVGSPGALAAQQGAAATTNLAAGNLAYTPGMTGAQFAQANPEKYASFMKANPGVKNSFMDSFRENILQPANEGLNNPFSKKGLMTIGGAGATMATSDYAKKKENEMEQENAERMGFIGDYYDATEAMKDYFVNQDYTLEDVYGKGNVPSFLLADGGRVNKNVGGLLRLLAKPAAKVFDKVKTRLSRMTDDVEIYGSSDYADDTGAAFSAFAMPKTKKGLRELNKLADEGLITKEADGAFDLGQETRMEALEELFPYMGKNLKASGAIDDINEFRNIKQLQEGSSGYGPDYGFDEILEYITRGRKAEGGLMGTRAGYNMGGMGSIPQTPMVPQGMQLDGRGGGFIPMGAQEKKDDVPAMLAKNEFVMTSDAVKAAGGGSVEKGAQKMYDLMNQLEAQV